MIMDDKSTEKVETFMDNILTMAGAACLIYPLIRQATKTMIPEMQKLTSGEVLQEIKMLPDEQEKRDKPEKEEHKPHENEVAELKRKLAEYESKSHDNKSE